jgi:RimJ/RimL family protein N-acetyltransferase
VARMDRLPTLTSPEITSDRLLLRKAHDGDRERFIQLQTDPRVRTHLGGPRSRSAVKQYLDTVGTANVTADPGVYVIADKETNVLIGTLTLNRRSADRPGHLAEDGEELELSYLLRRSAWGAGLAFEATTTALRAAAANLPDQPVLLVTQTANDRSLRLAARLGFQPVSTFEEFGAQQTLAVARLHTLASSST